MPFTRSTIRSLAKDSGVEIPKELEDALVSEHIKARDAYSDEQVKAELAKQPTKAVKVEDSEEFKKLKNDFDKYKSEVSAKEARAKKETAYRAILADAGLSDKGIAKAVKYADWDKIEVDDDGKIKDATSHLKAAKEEWAEYVVTTTTTGAKTSTPPANTGGSVKTKEEIYKMENGRYVLSASERQAELAKLYQHEKGE